MDYGWLTLEDGGTQQAGFFIDESNRILYWPEKEAPGYVVDEETAVKIMAIENPALSAAAVINIVVCLVMLEGSRRGAHLLYPHFVDVFSPATLTLVVMFLILGGYLAVVLPWLLARNRSRKVHRVTPILSLSPQVAVPRPKPQKLRPSATSGRFVIWVATPLLAALGGFLAYAGILPDGLGADDPAGDRLTHTLLGFALVGMAVFLLLKELTGTTVAAIQFYVPSEMAPGPVDDALNSPRESGWRRRLASLGRWITDGWGFWVVALPAVVVVVVLLVEWQEEPLTPDALATHFERSVFDQGMIQRKAATVVRWPGPVTAFVGRGGGALLEDIEETLVDLAKVAGLELTLTPTADGAPLSVTFVPGLQKDAEGNNDFLTIVGQTGKGEMKEIRFRYSQKSFDIWLPEAYYGNSDAMTDLNARIATGVGLNALGLMGDFDHDHPWYEDRNGDRVRLAKVLTAMYYDPRIRGGMTREQAMPIARIIAEEIVAADSVAAWMENGARVP